MAPVRAKFGRLAGSRSGRSDRNAVCVDGGEPGGKRGASACPVRDSPWHQPGNRPLQLEPTPLERAIVGARGVRLGRWRCSGGLPEHQLRHADVRAPQDVRARRGGPGGRGLERGRPQRIRAARERLRPELLRIRNPAEAHAHQRHGVDGLRHLAAREQHRHQPGFAASLEPRQIEEPIRQRRHFTHGRVLCGERRQASFGEGQPHVVQRRDGDGRHPEPGQGFGAAALDQRRRPAEMRGVVGERASLVWLQRGRWLGGGGAGQRDAGRFGERQCGRQHVRARLGWT